MAKNTTKGNNENKERETIKITSISLPEDTVREVKGTKGTTIFFTMKINGVTIYNCKIMHGKNGDFISFPQTQGKDGNYYSIVWVPLSDSDSEKIIAKVKSFVKSATPDDDNDVSEELPFA